MLIKAKEIKGYKLNALDGEIGCVKEFYFDDKFWTVRYLVAEIGRSLLGKQVLISPNALNFINKEEKLIHINLTKKQIEDSPLLNTNKPVSKLRYGAPNYWSGYYMWGDAPNLELDKDKLKLEMDEKKSWGTNLYSSIDVSGQYIKASDGEIGHVDDFIIDDKSWNISYLVIDTKNWWVGKKVLVSPECVEHISWEEYMVFVNLTKWTIKESPEFIEDYPLSQKYEAELHQYYNQQANSTVKPLVKVHSL